MSIKGFSSQKKLERKLTGFTDKQSIDTNEFATVQKTYSAKVLQDVVPSGYYRIHVSVKTATPNVDEPKRVFTSTAHGASPGDVVRFETTSANPGFESGILSIPDANTIILISETPNNILGTDNFYILRYVSQRVDDTGAGIVSLAPSAVAYKLNGTLTEVSQNTVTPSNSRPLPTKLLNPDGTDVTPSTAALQTAGNVLIGAVTETVPGTDTASSGLNGRLQRIAQRLTSLIAQIPAVLGQTIKSGSMSVTIASDDDLQTKIGILTETAPGTDTASSGLNGRLQRVAQNLTTLNTTSLKSSVVSTANSTTTPLAANGVFTGTSEVVQDYATIMVTLFTNVASATNGCSFQQSQDNTNWDITDVYTIPALTAGGGKTFSFAPQARYWRIVYTNGVTIQTTFRMQTVYHYVLTRNSSHSLAGAFTNQNDGELVIAQMRGQNSTNTVALQCDSNGLLGINNVNINGVAMATGNGTQVAGGVQRVVIASDQLAYSVKLPGKTSTIKARIDYTSTPVTTAAYTQVIASVGATAISEVEIFDSSGQTLFLAVGAAASEVDQIYIFPGGNGRVSLNINSTNRVAVKAVSGTANIGELIINFYV